MLLRNRETERRLMSKRTRDDKSKNGRPEIVEPTPPRLSEALIAQLQQAVSAAQRRRNPERIDAPEIGSNEKD
jgi:hypothetical protein